ncbi:hypothetical protein HF086_004810 [Spodoptera exigua]|uniref:Uncharacterized protein n=1 Tax=Spodoptera exigua TaxID=7107 RepID=A0A922M4G1_SPOEX|nr:hypothetical protein HF086_004810 [Spodoptera exigua]
MGLASGGGVPAGSPPSPSRPASLRHSPASASLRSVTRYSERFTERILPFTALASHVFQISNVPRDVVK